MNGLFPYAMTALECMTGHGRGADVGVWLTFWLCASVIVGYLLICVRWLRACSHSWIAWSLAILFAVCAVAGYATFMVSIWWPDFAYSLRLELLVVLNVCNVTFLVLSRGNRFTVVGQNERLGVQVRDLASIDDENTRLAEVEKMVTELRDRLHKATL